MRFFSFLWLLSACFALVTSSFLRAAESVAGISLVPNGDFSRESSKAAGWPDGWPRPEGATWEKEADGSRFVRLQSAQPGKMVFLFQQVILPSPAPAALEIRLRVRHTDIKAGEKPWFDGRVISHFKNRDGKKLKPEPETPSFRGSSRGWVDRAVIAKVPAGAHMLEVMPSLFQAASGTLDIARCEVVTASAAQLPKLITVPSVPVAPADASALPPALQVAGKQLQTAAGQPVLLQGLCVDSLQWAAGGEKILVSIPVAIDQWKANAIRLPVTEKFWAGQGPYQKKGEGGMAYRKLVDEAVAAAASRGAYLILDLHRFGAPMPEHVEFWKDAATRYKNHPAVLFELFNEAHGLSWPVWRDGGALKGKANQSNDVNAAENQEQPTGEVSVGMQALVDAVRSTGAKNVVIAGGLDWGYDLSGVVGDFALSEREGGNGIMYSSHVYPWKSNWQKNTLDAAAKFPVFVGEVGCPPDYSSFQFIPPAGRHELAGWPQDMLAAMQKHQLHWTGFSFHPKTGPMVISDWQYTPTPYWGVFVKEALAGKVFELKKLR